jgi:acylglycerol lipase
MNTSAITAHEETMEGVEGVNIFALVWRPTQPARGVVIIVHDFNSHSGQYQWAAEQFTARA